MSIYLFIFYICKKKIDAQERMLQRDELDIRTLCSKMSIDSKALKKLKWSVSKKKKKIK